MKKLTFLSGTHRHKTEIVPVPKEKIIHRIFVINHSSETNVQLRKWLENAGFFTQTVNDLQTTCQSLRQDRPDLLVFNLDVPGQDHWDLIQLIQSDPALAAIPVVMIAHFFDDHDKIFALDFGVDEIMAKPISSPVIVARINAFFRRSRSVRLNILKPIHVGTLSLDTTRRELHAHGELVPLTPAEYGLIRMFMESPGKAFTRAELLEKALDRNQDSLSRTLDTHIKNLRRKIEPDPRNPIHIQTVYGVGYRLMAA